MEDPEEEEYKPQSHLAGLQRDSQGRIICPYLDTINRSVLDFDFEKICSVSLATSNVYACLVCGKYFQGRGRNSVAYAHSLDVSHHVFINLANEEIHCLPDGYRVEDKSLEDIQYNLHPKFTKADVAKLDKRKEFVHALDGTDYLPGLIGLNNTKHTDWLNALVQALNFIPMFRDKFIVDQNWDHSLKAIVPASKTVAAQKGGKPSAAAASSSSSSAASSTAVAPVKAELATKYGELLAKLWNPRAFKAHVSPHELLQTIAELSGKMYVIGKFADCLQVLSWFLHELHRELGVPVKGKSKHIKQSIVTDTFQGELKITTHVMPDANAAEEEETKMSDDGTPAPESTSVEYVPFRYLSLALPPTPLFADSTDKSILPQVPLFELLKKFDGQTVEVTTNPKTKREERKTYQLTKLPPYLILHYQRFSKNTFFAEKNPTLVNFPLESLEMRPYVTGGAFASVSSESDVRSMSISAMKAKLQEWHVRADHIVEKEDLVQLVLQSAATHGAASMRYHLLSSIVHDGKANEGSYKCHTLHLGSRTWYTTEDTHVWTTETMAQQIALSEAFIQIYARANLLEMPQNA